MTPEQMAQPDAIEGKPSNVEDIAMASINQRRISMQFVEDPQEPIEPTPTEPAPVEPQGGAGKPPKDPV